MARCNNYLTLTWIFVFSFPESKAWRKLDKANIRNILRVEKKKGNEMKDKTKLKANIKKKWTNQTIKIQKNKNNNTTRQKKKQITPSPPPNKTPIICTHWMLDMIWIHELRQFSHFEETRQGKIVPGSGMVPRFLLRLC